MGSQAGCLGPWTGEALGSSAGAGGRGRSTLLAIPSSHPAEVPEPWPWPGAKVQASLGSGVWLSRGWEMQAKVLVEVGGPGRP